MSNFPAPLKIKDKKIERLLASTGKILREILKENWPKELNSQIDRDIIDLADTKNIKRSTINKCWTHTYNEEKRSTLKLQFFYAKLYYLCAKAALDEYKKDEEKYKEKKEEAWSFLFHASNLIGLLDGCKHQKEEDTFRKIRASKGGNELKLKKSKIKDKIRELLENPPKGGWRSESSTIDEILSSQDLKDFISSIEAERTIGDLKEFITSEIVLNPENQEIYQRLRSRK
ncbi:hypothetical protein ACEPUZ_13605 [Pseudomonas aeruginosa]|nr:hypothetical protein [Pseudomonas aeruginosa]HCF7142674.1 hypothetical protein [Pseudomonas aeruginosa]HCF7149456.1 hypothetical protein [Pseudomonas aeruginosa]